MIFSELKIDGLVLSSSHPLPRVEGVRNFDSVEIISPLGEIKKGAKDTRMLIQIM
jgi:hypothetical protein